MKAIYFIILLLTIITQGISQSNFQLKPKSPQPDKAQFALKQGHLDKNLRFIENKNQWIEAYKFRADMPGGFVFLKNTSLQYSLYDQEAIRNLHPGKPSLNKVATPPQAELPVKAHNVEVKFLNANALATPTGAEESAEIYNYFLGNDTQKWASNVRSYHQVRYTDLYLGIDLKFYEKNNAFKYEFIVSPTTNPQQIQLQYNGANNLTIEDGNLLIQTTLGLIIEKKPYCYQVIDNQEISIPANFQLKNNILTYEFPQGYHTQYPLIIDPELVFSSYSGSTTDNWGSTATYDDLGNLYSGGIILNPGNGFPTTLGAFQLNYGGSIDIGVLKFNPSTGGLIYATYLGGTAAEFPHSLVVNKNRELVILGTTSSTNFPTTPGAFDNSFNGGLGTTVISGVTYNNGSDIFVSKLNPDGTALLGSTYLGGAANDGINTTNSTVILNYGDQFRGEVITDNDNFIYLTSLTSSIDFPTKNAFQNAREGAFDGVLVKFNPNLTDLEWSTYFGGAGFDAAYSMKINSQNQLYVCGVTQSLDLRINMPVNPSIPAPLNANFSGSTQNEDGFVAKFDNLGMPIQATYIGTTAADQVYLLDLDPEENILIAGLTRGIYPIFQANYSRSNSGQFIQKLDANLSTSLMSTTIGTGRGRPDISLTAFMVNECGNIYLAGWGSPLGINTDLATNNLPTTADAFRRTTDGADYYIIILEKNAHSLLYATFFGGTATADHVDGGTSRFDKSGVIYHAACASCGGSRNDFPTTASAWSRTNQSSNCNNAAFKFDIGRIIANFDVIDTDLNVVISQACHFPINAKIGFRGSGAITWAWEIDGVAISTAREFNYTFTREGVYRIKLTAENPVSCLKSVTVEKDLVVSAIDMTVSPDIKICKGDSIILTATANRVATYQWTPVIAIDNARSPNPKVYPSQNTQYRVVAIDVNGCRVEKTIKVEVSPPIQLDFDIKSSSECLKPSVVNFTNRTQGATNFEWLISNGQVFTNENPEPYEFDQKGTYTITLRAYNDVCEETASKTIAVEDNKTPLPNVITPNGDDKNQLFVLEERKNYRLEIYDRWGGLIYKSDNYQDDWGSNAPAGMYYYITTSPQGIVCRGWLQVMK
ncbi:MAG: gliding motility-associated C-terminal domain-containing protein [Microscillaceae bacterium]|nr:gliding motility-associated C-terminal domain-containing protein [Microscillaceae bacterium]